MHALRAEAGLASRCARRRSTRPPARRVLHAGRSSPPMRAKGWRPPGRSSGRSPQPRGPCLDRVGGTNRFPPRSAHSLRVESPAGSVPRGKARCGRPPAACCRPRSPRTASCALPAAHDVARTAERRGQSPRTRVEDLSQCVPRHAVVVPEGFARLAFRVKFLLQRCELVAEALYFHLVACQLRLVESKLG